MSSTRHREAGRRWRTGGQPMQLWWGPSRFPLLLIAVLAVAWLALLGASAVSAAAAGAAPRIGLVLSGGGARGAAHIGVLKVLEELRIPLHAIAGTSMGALVGGAYASGVPVPEMERRIAAIDWNDLFTDDPPRPQWPVRRKYFNDGSTWDFTIGRRDGEFRLPKGAIAGQKVQLFFADLVGGAEVVADFDRLPIPFRAVATNLENGGVKVFDGGSMAEALRASMSVPGLFAPFESQDGIYVDGGLVRNLPVNVAREMGVDVVIAVNLGTSYLQREQLGTIVGVAGQMIAILTEQNVQRSLAELRPDQDVLIVPELGDISAADFERAAEAIAVGEAAAREAIPRLSRFSVDAKAYAAWRAARFERPDRTAPRIAEVEIRGLQSINPELMQQLSRRHEGQPLRRDRLEDDLQALYGRGDFERISYRLQPRDDGSLLIVDAVEKAWGPGYLNFGLGLSSDLQGNNRFAIQGRYRQTWINELGGEWVAEASVGNEPRIQAEFYQPFKLDRSGFIAPYLDVHREPFSLYAFDDRIARYDVTRYRLGVDIGTTRGSSLELRAGAYLGATRFQLDTGDPRLPEGDRVDSGVVARLLYDTLDSVYAPRRGKRWHIAYRRPLEAFGAEVEYHRLHLRWDGAVSRGDDTLVASLRGGSSFGDDMPYYDQFILGGFLNLTGYADEQFRGNDMAYAGLVYYRRINTLPAPLGRGLYLGGSLEFGRVWSLEEQLGTEKNRYGAGVFFGADSWLGPLYLGWGLSAEGDDSFYVLLGNP